MATEARIVAEANTHVREATRLDELANGEKTSLAMVEAQAIELRAHAERLHEAEAAFGRSGVQSFVLEGVLGEVQVRTGDECGVC